MISFSTNGGRRLRVEAATTKPSSRPRGSIDSGRIERLSPSRREFFWTLERLATDIHPLNVRSLRRRLRGVSTGPFELAKPRFAPACKETDVSTLEVLVTSPRAQFFARNPKALMYVAIVEKSLVDVVLGRSGCDGACGIAPKKSAPKKQRRCACK